MRALQSARFQDRLERLPRSSDVWSFDGERTRLVERIAALEIGDDICLQAWELADELVAVVGLKPRFDQCGPRCFRITGDELVPEEYEKVSTVP